MKKSVLIAIAIATASPAFAGSVRTVDCDAEIAECYRTISATCPGGFKIIDRNSFYGDGLVRDLPPRTLFFSRQYNTVVYQCG
jgi:hypothetical protein